MGKRPKVSKLPKEDDAPVDSPMDDFLDELQEEGEVDSIGSFSIDLERARQPFVEFSDGLLLILSAALVGGATQIQVTQVRSSWSIAFDVAPPKPECVKNLPHLMFDIGTDPWLRELGLAFNGLFPTHCDAIHWNAGTGLGAGFSKGQWALETVADQPTQQIRLEPLRSYPWQLKFWVGHKQIFQALQGRLGHFPIELQINGKPVVRPLEELSSDWPHVQIRVTSTSSLFSIHHPTSSSQVFDFDSKLRCSMFCDVSAGRGVGRFILVYRGITMGEFELVMAGLVVTAVVHTDRVDLDLSRRKVVENERLDNLKRLIRSWVHRGMLQWIIQIQPDQVFSNRGQLLDLCLSAPFRNLVKLLSKLPLVPAANGRDFFSLEKLRAAVERFGRLFSAGPGAPAYLHERPVMRPLGDDSRRINGFLGSRIESIDEWLKPDPFPQLGHEHAQLFELEFGRNDWAAKLIAFEQPGPANLFKVSRCGQFFALEEKITFLRQMLHQFVIVVDFNSDEPLEKTVPRLQKEIPLEFVAQIPDWLNQLCQTQNPTQEYRQRFEQLMLIRKSYKPQHEPLKRWLNFVNPESGRG